MLPLSISLNQRTILGVTRAKQVDKDPFGKTLTTKESQLHLIFDNDAFWSYHIAYTIQPLYMHAKRIH